MKELDITITIYPTLITVTWLNTDGYVEWLETEKFIGYAGPQAVKKAWLELHPEYREYKINARLENKI